MFTGIMLIFATNSYIYFCLIVVLSLYFILEYAYRYLKHYKFKLKNNINEADDLFTNFASMIPSLDQANVLENKALTYLQGIKGALSSKFGCEIRIMACGSIPERFAVPLVQDWISDINKGPYYNHALFSDQDFLIEPCGITATYSAQSDTIEIVESESCIEEGYAKLRVSKGMSTFNVKDGFLSTDTIKHSVKRCISKEPMTNFPGVDCNLLCTWHTANQVNVKSHGPAVEVRIMNLMNEWNIYKADFTFCIPCLKWPSKSNWPSSEKIWPDHTVVTTIEGHGFHFVPISQKNDASKTTWRYSFSSAERELSKNVNEKARRTFICLKIIRNNHLKPICKSLSSYHLKTILFRTLEVTSANIWNEKNILDCLDYLLKKLQEAFHEGRSMHFWISGINLFKDFENGILRELEIKVKDIRKNPVPFLLTYSFVRLPACVPFTKNEKELSCFCCGFRRTDCIWRIQVNEIRNGMSEEAAAEDNHVRVTIEEAPLNIDSYPVRSQKPFSQKENL